jgi:hypothetical protein
MPKHEQEPENEDEAITRLLMPISEHSNLLKKASVKNVPEDTLRYLREDVFPDELREFVRRLMVVTDYTKGMKTVMPKHVYAAYKSMCGKRLVYKRRTPKRRVKKSTVEVLEI